MGIETALLAAAVGTEVLGGVKEAQAADAAGDAAERSAAINARIAQKEAGFSEQQRRRETRRIFARQRLLAGASGLTPTGSFLDVVGDSAEQAEIAALSLRYGGTSQAARFVNQGQLAKWESEQARDAAIIKTIGNVFGGGFMASQTGAFGGSGQAAAGGTAMSRTGYTAGQFDPGTGRMVGGV